MKRAIVAMLTLAMLAACSSGKQQTSEQKPAAKPAAKPTETATGREAMQRLYVVARGWAADARPIRLESSSTSDADGHEGKSAVWRGYFGSPGRRMMKPFLWSGSSAEGAPEHGVTPATEDTWNPANTSAQAYDIAFLKVDSDKAFAVAQAHGGDKILKAEPKLPAQYALAWNPLNNELVWHVIYGNSANDAKLRVAVNGSTGAFIRVEK
jgi:hypothetical protein